jgi:hypothetical protein
MKHFQTILLWISSLWFSDLDRDLRRTCIRKWLKLLGKYIRTKGLVWTIKRIKLIRLVVTRYLAGSPLYKVDSLLGIRDGFPKSIWFMKNLIDDGRPTGIRFALTLLTVSRAMQCEAKPSYESITNEFTGEFSEIDPEFVSKFVTDFGLSLTRPVWSRAMLFFTMKGGPLGHPVLTALHSLKQYDGPIWASVVIVIGLDGAQYLKSLLMKYRDHLDWKTVDSKVKNLAKLGYRPIASLRRLSVIQDPELKARIVGIVDYFTQVILEPLSKQLFELLRSLPQDRTFTQDPHIKVSAGQKYHSLDLSNATDRFPLDVQKQLLAEMLGGPFAHAWGALMTYNSFEAPNGRAIRYAVGQPIGARSSWAMFTLSHHLVVQYAAHLVGVYPFKDYILLGDDIVITNDEVALKYVELMTGLGVEISNHKTHVSLTTYEFAKRWFHHGIEVTGFPVNSIKSTLEAPLELYGAVMTQFDRGLVPLDFTGSVEAVLKLYKTLGWDQRKLNTLLTLLESFRFTLRNLRSFNPDEVRAFIATNTFRKRSTFYPDEVRNFFATNTFEAEDEYVIPASEAMLESELTRVSSAVVNGIVMGIMYRLSRYQAKLDAFCASTLITQSSVPVDTSNLPIRDSVANGIKDLVALGQRIDVWKELLPLLEITTVIDLDLLARRQRKSVVILYRLSSFGKSLRQQLRQDPNFETNITQNFRLKKGIIDLNRSMIKASQPAVKA